ncbi:MAG: MBL fold metallo-hydrolase [Legionella longbeachae]|nr:MBL fold metallo-hydrolase [Legionella longbeachae]
MLTNIQIQQAINNINILIANYTSSASYFSFENDQLRKNWFFKSNSEQIRKLQDYLQKLLNEVSNTDNTNPLYPILFISLQHFLHLYANRVIKDLNLNLEKNKYLKRKTLMVDRLDHVDFKNQFKNDLHEGLLPVIQYDIKTRCYTSPDDNKAHQHGSEARRIFFSTQWERLKGLFHWFFSKMGVYVFESASYKEHDYLDSDVYTNDTAIDPEISGQQTASHYWIGHASNLITIPTKDSPLHVLTDPVEGDLAPFIYPRMTKEGNLIDGIGNKKLPKIDVVVISHNHLDHMSRSTLKRLLKQQPKMIVPEGDDSFFFNMGFKDVVGLKWWEQARLSDEEGNELLRITAVPARHWSGRSFTDAHHSAFNGYVLHSDQLAGDIYFAGDTALMDDSVSQPIFEKFNIVTSIQPGGPDDRREDLESTHQSSADAIQMHFKILATQYRKMKIENEHLTFEEFLEKNKQLKTLYNHTGTFKLGNLRLKDTYFSFQRMIAAFQESTEWRRDHLPKHEQNVYDCIQSLVKVMIFKGGNRLNNKQISSLIQSSIVIPKIGQRQELYFTEKSKMNDLFQYRNLITHMQSLIHYAKWVVDFSTQHENKTKSKLKEYFACQKVRRLVDQELQHTDNFLGDTRCESKQQAFKLLSNQLVDLPYEVAEYQKRFKAWLLAKVNDNQSVQQLLCENRSSFFARGVMPEVILLNINSILQMK